MLKKLRRWLRYNLIYLGDPPWDTGISPPELLHFLQNHQAGRALDVGCGTGTNLLTMSECGWHSVGMDLSLISILRARKKLKRAGYPPHAFWGDVTRRHTFAGKFDLVLDIGCYHSLTERGREAYRQNLQQWLKRGGFLLIYAHRRTEPTASHGMDSEDITALGSFLNLEWQTGQNENRPNSNLGRASVWALFQSPGE